MWFLFKEKLRKCYCLEFQFNWITARYVTAEMFNWFSKKAGEKAQVHASI